jgi:hypothetical protein
MRKRIGVYMGRVVFTDGVDFMVFLCALRFKELAHVYRAIDEGMIDEQKNTAWS